MHGSGVRFRDYNSGWTNYMQGMMQTVVQYVEPYLAKNGGSAQRSTEDTPIAPHPFCAVQRSSPLGSSALSPSQADHPHPDRE